MVRIFMGQTLGFGSIEIDVNFRFYQTFYFLVHFIKRMLTAVLITMILVTITNSFSGFIKTFTTVLTMFTVQK